MMRLILVAGTLSLAIGCADNDIEPVATTTDYSSTTYAAAAAPNDSAADPNLAAERNEPAVVAGSQGTQTGLSDTNSLSQSDTNEAVGGPAPSESASSTTQQESGKFKDVKASNLEQYIDFKVVGSKQQEFGSVESLWENDKEQPAYLAIKSPQEEDKVYVIPAQIAEVNTQRQLVRVPYSIETLQKAPTFSKDADLTPQDETKVLAFFETQKTERAGASQDSSSQAQGNSASSQRGSEQSEQQANVGSNAETQDEATIRLKEERLNVEKRLVNNGGILLRKVVRTETVNRPVQLQREEIVIERVPGDGKAVENASFDGQEVFIPLRREEAVVNKDVVLKEVVNVRKKTEEQQREVSAQIREEELRILNQQGQRLNQGAAAQNASGSGQDTNSPATNATRTE